MYELKNNKLTVQLLDPHVDGKYLGSRYCVGGYVWQVKDGNGVDLLTGPQYPSVEPDTYHGQGAPDMFLKNLGGETAALGERVGVIGVGDVLRETQEPFHVASNRNVVAPIQWKIEAGSSFVRMTGEHRLNHWAYGLSRAVTLEGNTLRVATSLRNRGVESLPLCAFAHPFFPLTKNNRLCRLSVPVKPFHNEGFYLGPDQWICRRPAYDWENGSYQILEYEGLGPGMVITESHDGVGEVVTTLDFMPSKVAIWGNDRTFSFEPFIEHDLKPGDSTDWTLAYQFGRL